MRLGLLAHPIVLASVLTLANAAKPVVVDDTAYLLFARHIAANPADPYGFALFWYAKPEPAMDVLAPPVLPYWLAAGMRLFGEDELLLKLWLFPFAAVFAYSARSLLRTFTGAAATPLLPAVVLGPAVLPFLNFMLDVPALASALAAVAVFAGRRGAGAVVFAGVLAGMACQTKYSVLALPAVLVWYGFLHRRLRPALGVVAVGVGVFAAWEFYLVGKYGVSHFLHHLLDDVRSVGPGGGFAAALARKTGSITPLLGHLGAMTWWVGSLGWLALGIGRRTVIGGAVLAGVVAVILAFLPGRYAVLIPGPNPASDSLTMNGVLFTGLGGIAVGAGVGAAAVLTLRSRRGAVGFVRRNADAWFLAGWLAIEVVAALSLTPFPAARRVLGVSFVLAVVVGRLAGRVRRLDPGRWGSWIAPAAVASGVGLAAVDAYDARAERDVSRAANEYMARPGTAGAGWFVGHWGFQYYCDREGLRPLAPGTDLRPGDWVLVPEYPDESGFYRLDMWAVAIDWNGPDVEHLVTLTSDDRLSARTIPNLYGGKVPVVSRKAPRLRVAVYRVVRPTRA